jgi:hypothetical protein
MSDTRRTGEEPVPCLWFAMCDQTTDIESNHPVLGWTPICEGCAKVVGLEVPPQPAGWRVRATFTQRGWKRTETKAFMNPLKAKCVENIRMQVQLWHPEIDEMHLEVLGPVYSGASNWGSGRWTESFKREETP